MRPISMLLLLVSAGSFSTSVWADNCSDMAMRFAGAERFSMKPGELDELKTCINTLLRDKISATSNEARGSTLPQGGESEASAQAERPSAPPVYQDAE